MGRWILRYHTGDPDDELRMAPDEAGFRETAPDQRIRWEDVLSG